MKLGELIEWLRLQDSEMKVSHGFGEPMSHRGDYTELAFEPKENVTFGDMLNFAESALDKHFTGYKGGEFLMDQFTECYIASYGHCGSAISRTILNLWTEHAFR